MDVRAWLSDWLVANADVGREEVDRLTGTHLVESGVVDSVRFVRLVAEIEDAWDIRLTNDDLEDPGFFTPEGMARTVARKLEDGTDERTLL